MAVRYLTTLLTISMVLGTGRALTCNTCKGTSESVNGVIVYGEQTECKTTTCDDGADVCVEGTWRISGKRKLAGSEDLVLMEISMIYFKNCAEKATATCEAIEAYNTEEFGEEVKDIKFSGCTIETCDTDNCNTKTPKEINSAYSEPISCYTCSHEYVGDLLSAQECTDDNKKTCPLGVTQCVYGNLDTTIEEDSARKALPVNYFKDCGGGLFDSCDVLKKEMSAIEAFEEKDFAKVEIVDCNIGTCSGDLCNTKTQEEIKAYESGSSAVRSAITLLTAYIIYFTI